MTAPWPALAVVGALVAAYLLQVLSGQGDSLIQAYGFAPADLDSGRLLTLLTYQFLHGGWPHVGMNAVWALAFAPPVARYFGDSLTRAAAFFLFYLVCGVLAALGYAVLHLHEPGPPLVGASGAVAGLMGAGSRLLVKGGGLAPLTQRNVLAMGATWMVINLVLGLIGFAPGMGPVTIAWEAHIAGYGAGLLLIGPAVRFISRS